MYTATTSGTEIQTRRLSQLMSRGRERNLRSERHTENRGCVLEMVLAADVYQTVLVKCRDTIFSTRSGSGVRLAEVMIDLLS